MNKIALCFYGLPPIDNNKNIILVNNTKFKDLSNTYWKKNFLDINKPDIFIHSWGENDPENLKKKFIPKLYIFEKQKEFKENENFYSQAYSMKRSVELKKKYELENNIKYDLVFVSRMDLLCLRPIELLKLDSKYFYISNWNQKRKKKNNTYLNNYTTESRNMRKILAYWILSNSDFIDKFCLNLYDYIPEYLEENKKTEFNPSNHTLKKKFLVKISLWESVKFIFYDGYDFEVQRKYYRGDRFPTINDKDKLFFYSCPMLTEVENINRLKKYKYK